MNLKEKYEKVKTWTIRNKVVYIGMGIATAFVVSAIIAGTKKDEQKQIDETKPESLEEKDEKDIIIQFVDSDTNEVLWKEICSEEYLEDMKFDGMQYENIRKLNGIE
jgi:hypothetical protein